MKKILLLVFAMANTVVYAQSKKQQIIILNNRVDSFRLALSKEIKLSNENSIKLNNRIDSFRLALSRETQVKLSNEKRDALKINNLKIEIKNSEAELEAERNRNNILQNEIEKKELIIDSLKAESKKSTCIKCNEYAVGQRFVKDGVTYTVADRKMLVEALEKGEDLTKYCTSKVTDMSDLLNIKTSVAASFNQDIGNWDVSNVTDMGYMFDGAASFNQDLTQWCVSNIVSEPKRFSKNSGLSPENHPIWGTCP